MTSTFIICVGSWGQVNLWQPEEPMASTLPMGTSLHSWKPLVPSWALTSWCRTALGMVCLRSRHHALHSVRSPAPNGRFLLPAPYPHRAQVSLFLTPYSSLLSDNCLQAVISGSRNYTRNYPRSCLLLLCRPSVHCRMFRKAVWKGAGLQWVWYKR